MKTTNSSFIHIGFSSIIMLLITVCISSFAGLTVLTAHSNYKNSIKIAEKTAAYYEADALAKKMVESIDNQLYHIYLTNSSATSFYNEVSQTDFEKDAPDGIHNILLENTSDTITISYMVTVSDIQNLHITLKINYPYVESECFSTITRWQTSTEYTSLH